MGNLEKNLYLTIFFISGILALIGSTMGLFNYMDLSSINIFFGYLFGIGMVLIVWLDLRKNR